MSECHCSFKDGQFSLILNDVRLISLDGHGCSSSNLQVGIDTFNCTPQKMGNYGSVFNVVYSETKLSSISLKLWNTETVKGALPQMTWLIITPEGQNLLNFVGKKLILYASLSLLSNPF